MSTCMQGGVHGRFEDRKKCTVRGEQRRDERLAPPQQLAATHLRHALGPGECFRSRRGCGAADGHLKLGVEAILGGRGHSARSDHGGRSPLRRPHQSIEVNGAPVEVRVRQLDVEVGRLPGIHILALAMLAVGLCLRWCRDRPRVIEERWRRRQSKQGRHGFWRHGDVLWRRPSMAHCRG
jgi:hypothetical protein